MGGENLLQLQRTNTALCDKVFRITAIDANTFLFYSGRQ